MLDILLINSPIYNYKTNDDETFLPPFGLGYIGNELKKNDISVELLDCVFQNLTLQEIFSIIKMKQPRFIGINIFSINFKLVKNIIEKCDVATTFIVGGRSVRALCNEILNFKTSNKIITVIGEGDYITTDIVLEKVKEKPFQIFSEKRIAYKVDKYSIYFPHNLSLLSPDRSMFQNRVLINSFGYFIYGFPKETFKQCQKTFELAQKLLKISKNFDSNFRASAFSFRPYHGTRLYEEIKTERKRIDFLHDDSLNKLPTRKQFNFSAGNFSVCSDGALRDFIIHTNMLK